MGGWRMRFRACCSSPKKQAAMFAPSWDNDAFSNSSPTPAMIAWAGRSGLLDPKSMATSKSSFRSAKNLALKFDVGHECVVVSLDAGA